MHVPCTVFGAIMGCESAAVPEAVTVITLHLLLPSAPGLQSSAKARESSLSPEEREGAMSIRAVWSVPKQGCLRLGSWSS